MINMMSHIAMKEGVKGWYVGLGTQLIKVGGCCGCDRGCCVNCGVLGVC